MDLLFVALGLVASAAILAAGIFVNRKLQKRDRERAEERDRLLRAEPLGTSFRNDFMQADIEAAKLADELLIRHSRRPYTIDEATSIANLTREFEEGLKHIQNQLAREIENGRAKPWTRRDVEEKLEQFGDRIGKGDVPPRSSPETVARLERGDEEARRETERFYRRAMRKRVGGWAFSIIALIAAMLLAVLIGNMSHGIPPDAMCAGTGQYEKCMRRIAICAEARMKKYHDECVRSVVDKM